MDYYEMGSLHYYLYDPRSNRPESRHGYGINEDQAINILKSIAKGVLSINKRDYVHRDLKPENIFMVSDEEAVVAGLGLLTHMDQC